MPETIEPLPAYPRHRPLVVLALIVVTQLVVLRLMGRIWWCECGGWFPWTNQAWGPHNSQHLGDPYFFSHVLHGVVFYWALVWTKQRVHWLWALAIATSIEAMWEIVENTPYVIDLYRSKTAALGYTGDTILNSATDTLAAIAGFLIARKVGLWWSITIYLGLELFCAWWIKDGLTLNVIMLLYPVEFIKKWQSGG